MVKFLPIHAEVVGPELPQAQQSGPRFSLESEPLSAV